jgi:hypothetical protein
MGGKIPQRPKLPKDWRKWTDQQSRENDEYQDAIQNEFSKITKKFGWE